MKKIEWEGSSLKDLNNASKKVRQVAGYELMQIQCGGEPSDWKPMSSVGKGVKEIRIHLENEYRVLYVARFEEAIYVLHAFTKKTQKTSKKDIDLAKTRFLEVLKRRRN